MVVESARVDGSLWINHEIEMRLDFLELQERVEDFKDSSDWLIVKREIFVLNAKSQAKEYKHRILRGLVCGC